MKKLAGALATILLTSSLASTVIAAPTQNQNPDPGKSQQEQFQQKEHFKINKGELREVIKESMQKNNGNLQKVKADVDKFHAERLLLREAHLAIIAKEQGISPEELKSRLAQKRQERLESKAKEAGLTPEELKNIMQAKHQKRLEAMAKDLGLSLEQLKQILPADPMKKL